MSRIESSSSTPVPIDTSPETGPAPAASKGKEARAPAARNEVRTYDGPPARASQKPSSQPPPASSGPSISAGEMLARGGRLGAAKPPSAEVPERVYSDIRSSLTWGVGNLRIDADDLKAVHTALGTLQPGAYRAALERMEKEGLLGDYVKELGPDTRRAFLEQAESKGLLERREGTAPAGPLGYPAEPDFFRNDPKLPESMRTAVNQHAMDVGKAYYHAHAEYLGRYVDAVNGAKGLRAIRALGEPQGAQLQDSALGIGRNDARGEQYAAQWRRAIGQPRSLNLAYQTVNARHRELTGERAGGSIQLHGKGSFSAHGVKLSEQVQVDTRGKAGTKEEAGVVLKGGGGLELELSKSGSGEKSAEVSLDLGLFKVSVDSEGTQKLELGAGESAKVFVSVNREKAEFGGGASTDFKAGGVELEGETGFNMKGLEAGRVRESFDKDHRGVFDLPRELEAGTSWDALPEAQRKAYAKEDWTREEWTQTLAREQRKRQ